MSAAEKCARPSFRQHAECDWAPCRATYLIKAPGQRFCSDTCRHQAKHAGNATSPAYRQAVRDRCRAWAAEKRGCKQRRPWLLGPPVFDSHLPGGFLEIFSETPLKWPLEHRNLRGLHGAITALSDEGHDPQTPQFALVPWYRGVGWGVYFMGSDALDRMSGTRHEMRLYEQVLSVRFGGAFRMKSPHVAKRGRRRLRVDTITPVCTRAEKIAHLRASGPNLLSTMCAWLPRRLGIEIGESDACLELIANDTCAAHVPMGGKYGTVSGWSGSLVVETNAVGEWLFRAAEVIGLGGQCARGFGRIKVSHAG